GGAAGAGLYHCRGGAAAPRAPHRHGSDRVSQWGGRRTGGPLRGAGGAARLRPQPPTSPVINARTAGADSCSSRSLAADCRGAQAVYLCRRELLTGARFSDIRRLEHGAWAVRFARIIQADDVIERVRQVLIGQGSKGGHDAADDGRIVHCDAPYHAEEDDALQVIPAGRRGSDLARAPGEAWKFPGHPFRFELVAHRAIGVEGSTVACSTRDWRDPR